MAEVSIGDVLLIFISAFGGAWANSRFRGREAKKAEKEERKSLVFLIDTEVGFNVMRLGGTSKGPLRTLFPICVPISGMRRRPGLHTCYPPAT